MKKALLCGLALFLPNVNYSHEAENSHLHGAEIEKIVEDIPYKHPEPKEIGDFMPLVIGTPIYWIGIHILNSGGIEGALREEGYIQAYDVDGMKTCTKRVVPSGQIRRQCVEYTDTAEYEVVRRNCDVGEKIETYAVLDIPNERFYVDSDRDYIIDAVYGGIKTLEGRKISKMIKSCKQDAEAKK